MNGYGTKYRGNSYAKVYEVFVDGEMHTHAYSAKQARKEIDKAIAKKREKP